VVLQIHMVVIKYNYYQRKRYLQLALADAKWFLCVFLFFAGHCICTFRQKRRSAIRCVQK
jgi:hypothetical protein